jgi:hypothetical protein
VGPESTEDAASRRFESRAPDIPNALELDLENPVARFEARTTPPMAWLGFAFLLVLSMMLPGVQEIEIEHEGPIHFGLFDLRVLATLLFSIWALFVIEWFARIVVAWGKAPLSALGLPLLILIAPPLRMSLRSMTDRRAIWLPFRGWVPRGKQLARALEARFGPPMLMVALAILPVLALEFIWVDQVRASVPLQTALDIGTRIIWLAFAVEFVVLFSVAPRRIQYCKRNWVDIAIILLPLLSFLRGLRLARLGRVNRLARVYRMRGVGIKLLRAVMVLRVVERMSIRATQSKLLRLEAQLADREEELAELRLEMDRLRREVGWRVEARQELRAQKAERRRQRRESRPGRDSRGATVASDVEPDDGPPPGDSPRRSARP